MLDKTTRAVIKLIEPGSYVTCRSCDKPVKFVAKNSTRQVIVNRYENGKWKEVIHYHERCYNAREHGGVIPQDKARKSLYTP